MPFLPAIGRLPNLPNCTGQTVPPSLLMNTLHGRDRTAYSTYRRYVQHSRKFNPDPTSWILGRCQPSQPRKVLVSPCEMEMATRSVPLARARRVAQQAGRVFYITPPTPELRSGGRASVEVGRAYKEAPKRIFRHLRVTAPRDFSHQDDKEADQIAELAALSGITTRRVEEICRRWWSQCGVSPAGTNDLRAVLKITTACRIEAKELVEDMFEFCDNTRIHKISLEKLFRILGVFQLATAELPNCVPDAKASPDSTTLELLRREEMSKGKVYTTLKAKLAKYFFQSDSRSLLQNSSKTGLLHRMLEMLECGPNRGPQAHDLSATRAPNEDGAAVAGVMMGFLGGLHGKS